MSATSIICMSSSFCERVAFAAAFFVVQTSRGMKTKDDRGKESEGGRLSGSFGFFLQPLIVHWRWGSARRSLWALLRRPLASRMAADLLLHLCRQPPLCAADRSLLAAYFLVLAGLSILPPLPAVSICYRHFFFLSVGILGVVDWCFCWCCGLDMFFFGQLCAWYGGLKSGGIE